MQEQAQAPALPAERKARLRDRTAYRTIRILRQLWDACGQPFPELARRIRHDKLGEVWPSNGSIGNLRRMPSSRTFLKDVTFNGPDGRRSRVAVVIPCHDYGRFLAEAIESVLSQTAIPAEILVVDDASSDDTPAVAARYADRGVAYVKGEWRSVAHARNEGARLTDSPFLVFLDADDRLAPDYVEACLERLRDDAVAVAYGDMQRFGESGFTKRMPAFDADCLLAENFISSHAMIRRIAFDLVGGYRETRNAHQDWDLYRRIALYPQWKAAKADTHVEYRVHAGSMLQAYNRAGGDSFSRRAALRSQPVTIFTPFAGRWHALAPYIASLRNLETDPALVKLHWFNTSPDPAFDAALRDAARDMPFASVTYERSPLPASWDQTPASLIAGRPGGEEKVRYYYQMVLVYAYNALLRDCRTEFALVLEDDVLPAPDTLRRLLDDVADKDTVAVAAPYRCRFRGCWNIWKAGSHANYTERGKGIEEVGGSGFGCTLLRMSALRQSPITFAGDAPGRWYDHVAFDRLRERGTVLCDWDLEVDHLEADAGVATTTRSSTIAPSFISSTRSQYEATLL